VSPEVLYYLWAVLLVLAAVLCWLTNLFTLPGNWLTLVAAGLFAWLLPYNGVRGVSWITVAVLGCLAIAGEVIEFVAGAAGAAREGASRRSIVLAIVGTVIGSIAGAAIGIPIPIIGSLIAALGGGAAGAFAGAYLGETWKGRGDDQKLAVSKAALIGRLLGTLGKLAVGALMVVILAVDAFF
jgi:uncharacterized protein YqgC (DUF456 family)